MLDLIFIESFLENIDIILFVGTNWWVNFHRLEKSVSSVPDKLNVFYDKNEK